MAVALCSNKQQWWFNIGLINAEHCALRLITSSGRKQNADRVHNSGSCMSLKSLCLKSKSRRVKCWKSHKFACFIPGNALLKAIMFNSWAIKANWIWQQPESTRGSEVPRSKHTHTAFVFLLILAHSEEPSGVKSFMNSSVPLNRTLMIRRTWPCGGSVVNKTLLSAAWHLFGGRCDRICRRHGRLFAAWHLCGGLGAALFFTSVTAPCWSVGVQINVNTIEDHCLLLQTEAFFSHWALKETFVLNKSVEL